MGIALIENPGNPPAYDSAGQDNYQVFSNQIITLPCSAAVTAGTLVSVADTETSGVPGYATVAMTTATDDVKCIGVALNSTTAAGQLVQVVVSGLAMVNTVIGTFAPGAVFAAAATGIPTTASVTIGQNVGFFVATTQGTVPGLAFIQKM